MAEAKLDEFAFVLIAGLIIIIVMLLMWGVPSGVQIPVVTPDSQSLTINRGSSEKFILKINVTSDKVTLTPKGTIKSWISFSNNDFDCSGLCNVEVTVKVPSGTEEREYSGSIGVESAERGEASVQLTLNVIKQKTEVRQSSSLHNIGDFTVTYAAGSETIKSMANLEVTKDKSVSTSGIIEKDMSLVTDGSIIIYVYYTNNEGNLIVKFNNKVIFNQKVMPGRLEIPVDKEYLTDYNTIEISTSVPGWKFWADSVYKIDKIDFNVNLFGSEEKKETFVVSRDEIVNFKGGNVDFHISSVEGNGFLIVKINDRKVYEGKTTGDVSFRFEYVDVGLVTGENTISFSTETGTTYNIERAKITIFYGQY
jgi:hypothetical protein